MKTKRLIDWLNSVPTWYVSDGVILNEIIRRLKECDELEYIVMYHIHSGRAGKIKALIKKSTK